VHFLPRAHGSALFTRGETQAICTTTLGTKDAEQMIDGLTGLSYENFMLHFFTDFEFLMTKVAATEPKNVLCIFRNPTRRPDGPSFADFKFLGYDVVDRESSISALTNCGGFPDVFANSELSNVGLLTDFQRARQVQEKLRSLHPKESHTDCHLWAIFRLVPMLR